MSRNSDRTAATADGSGPCVINTEAASAVPRVLAAMCGHIKFWRIIIMHCCSAEHAGLAPRNDATSGCLKESYLAHRECWRYRLARDVAAAPVHPLGLPACSRRPPLRMVAVRGYPAGYHSSRVGGLAWGGAPWVAVTQRCAVGDTMWCRTLSTTCGGIA